jgi:glycosyltransferase involved in cell wall biosynthesis
MGKVTYKSTYSCIIPFYNESITTVVFNVREILKVKEIDLIVIIDDGSKSIANYEILRTLFINRPNVIVKRLSRNFGKTYAIQYASMFVPDGNVFLCDSDLKNLDNKEIKRAILKYDVLDLRMLILRRMNISFLPKIIRADTLLSGERILQKTDLMNIMRLQPSGYQLEVATNQYFVTHNLQDQCYWSPSSAVNNYKYKKLKFLKGMFKDLKMYYNIINYVGYENYLEQISNFCKKEI